MPSVPEQSDLRIVRATETDLAAIETLAREIWSRVYTKTGSEDIGYGVVPATGGGYVITGSTNAFDERGLDVLAMRIDEGGNVVWQRRFGGRGSDVGNAVVRRPEGGYLIVGTTSSTGAGQNDVLLLTIDEAGLKVAGP